MSRSLVVFHYFELDAVHRDNLAYFLRHGYRDDLDYVVVIAGGCTLELPVARNVTYLHTMNFGTDVAGYVHAVRSLVDPDRYDYVFFLNSSVRGPFLPAYCDVPWTEPFIAMLTGDVHLVGPTINILSPMSEVSRLFEQRYGPSPPYSHVQSMMFAIDREAFRFLRQKNFFDRPIGPGKTDVIADYEILLSQLILRNGWNISSLLPEYRNIDYRRQQRDINPASLHGDPCFADAYFGRSISPYEVIFVKTNRDVIPPNLLDRIGASLNARIRAGREDVDQASDFQRVTLATQSAWRGHKNFAIWLTKRLRPSVTVDLGVDFGFSTFCFASPGIGHVYGIDAFEGDMHAGFRNTKDSVEASLTALKLANVSLIQGYFSEVARGWSLPIDLLHIDGRHDYEDVREDYETWSRFVTHAGVILLHDTCVPEFGVRRFFDTISLPKLNFWTSHGLGIVSRNAALLSEIESVFARQVDMPLAWPAISVLSSYPVSNAPQQ